MNYTKALPLPLYTRLLALDIGERRIGIAGSDDLGLTAQSVETLSRTSLTKDVHRIKELALQRKAQALVLGLPRNMDGSYGFAAQRSWDFAKALQEELDLPILYEDERLTTASAQQILIAANMRRDRRKQFIDRLSAVMILESFLKRQERRKETMSEDMDRVVELIDEDGRKVKFMHEMTLHYEDADYALVVPVEGLEMEEEEDGEIIILKIVPGQTEEEDTYEGVEDDELLDTLYEMYVNAVEEMEEEE